MAAEDARGHKATSLAAVKDWRVLLLGLIQFGFVIGTYGVGLWLPLILKEYGYGAFKIGLLTAIPYLFACVGTFVWARFADRSKRHVMHLRLICVLGTIGFAISTLHSGVEVQLTGITLAVIAVFCARTIFWAIPSTFLGGRAAAGGLAVINTIGTLGGFVGTFAVGKLKEATGGYTASLWMMSGAFLMSVLLTFVLAALDRRHAAAAH
jgi:MFS transporter, ACS family, tartrate transporter